MFKRMSLMVVVCAGLSAAQDGALMSPDKPSAVSEIDARVVSVDVPKGQLTVKDTKDQVVTIRVGKATTISSSVSSKLVLKDLQANQKVHIYYTSADHMARQIDVSPAMPVLHDLGTQ